MTSIKALNQYENQLTFEMLESKEFDPNSQAKVQGVTLDLNETADDVVMLNGDNISINAKEGNNTIYVSGDKNVVNAGDGNNQVALWGTNSTAITGKGNDFMYIDGENLTATSISGDNIFRAYGNNNMVISGDGDNEVGLLGDGNKVILNNGNNYIAYYGNNNQINTRKGNSTAMTLDFALLSSDRFADMEDRWIETLDYTHSSEKIPVNTTYDYSCCTNGYYTALSEEDLAYAETIDMGATRDNGSPIYVIGADASGVARIYEYSYTYGGVDYYYPRGEEGIQTSKVAIPLANISTQEASYSKYDYYNMKYYTNYKVEGVSGNQIYFGDGDNTLKHTVADNTNKVDLADATTGHTLEQQTEYTFADTSKQSFTKYERVTKTFYVVVS